MHRMIYKLNNNKNVLEVPTMSNISQPQVSHLSNKNNNITKNGTVITNECSNPNMNTDIQQFQLEVSTPKDTKHFQSNNGFASFRNILVEGTEKHNKCRRINTIIDNNIEILKDVEL